MRVWPYFGGCAVVGVLALWLGLGLPLDIRQAAYQHGSLWWAVLTTALLLGCLIHAFRAGDWRRDHAADLALSAAGVALLAVLVPFRAYIEQDESSLLATAQRLLLDGQAAAIWQGLRDADGFLVPIMEGLDKRGMYFSFLQMLTLSLGIPAPLGAALLNLLLATLVVFLVIRLARRYVDTTAARLAGILLMAWPVFAVTSRSGLLDICNLALLLLVVHLTLSAWQRPSGRRILLLAAAAAVYAQLRYESIAVAAVCLSLILLRHGLGPGPRQAWQALLPLLLAPAAWRFAVPMDYEMPAPWFLPWALRNAPDNLERLFFWLFGPPGWLTAHPPVAIAGALALLLSLRSGWRQLGTVATVLPLSVLTFLSAVLMFSYWGQATLNLTVRYFLPIAMAASLGAAWLLGQLWRRWPQHWQTTAAALVAGSAFVVQMPRSQHPPTFEEGSLHQIRDLILEAAQQAYGDCNVVLVTNATLPLVTRGFGAVNAFHYRAIGVDGLRRASRDGLSAIGLVVQTRDGRPTIPLLPWLQPVTAAPLAEVRRGHRGIQVLSLWPAGFDRARCPERPPALGIRRDAAIVPVQAWTQPLLDRWSTPLPAGLEAKGTGMPQTTP